MQRRPDRLPGSAGAFHDGARAASGRVVDTKANTITCKLSYDALEGTVTQAHVHFGQKSVNGGISFFLCSNLGNGPPRHAGLPGADRPRSPGSSRRTWSSAGRGSPRRQARASSRGIRRDRGGHPGGRGLCQRPFVQVAGRRNPRPAALINEPEGLRPAPRRGAGRGPPYRFRPENVASGRNVSCTVAAGLLILR